MIDETNDSVNETEATADDEEINAPEAPLFLSNTLNQSLKETITNIPKITLPTMVLQNIAEMQSAFYVPALERMRESLANVSKMYIDLNRSVLNTGISRWFQNTELQETLNRILQNYRSTISEAFKSSAFQWFKSFDFSPIAEAVKRLADIDFEKIKLVYLQEMYDAHWFPYASWNADFQLSAEIFGIIDETRKSKNRVKRIDKAVFKYYSKEKIESIKKSWRSFELPEYQMRILHQAVQAYHRREYALTVIVLTTQWEGIIYNKANDSGRKLTKKTKQHMAELVSENDYFEIFNSYFEDFIMYDCNSTADVISDVPGRHSAAHSFYDKYPTRKAALNAILFTDFLLNLEPIKEDGKNDKNEHGIG